MESKKQLANDDGLGSEHSQRAPRSALQFALRLPDFIIGGAPRSGTTWLYELLSRHPDVFLAKPSQPEPKFFLVDDLYERGIEYYSQTWFAEARPGALVGEKSTNYLESATAACRIHRDLPFVKLVFILRNPVARAYSNYLWSRKNGLENEAFEQALALEEERERQIPDRLRYARPHAYFSRGLYADLLEPYLSLFGRKQILCLRFDDLRERPALLTDRLHDFLGLERRREDAFGLGVIRPSDPNAPPLSAETRAALTERYLEPNLRLATLLGDDFQMWADP